MLSKQRAYSYKKGDFAENIEGLTPDVFVFTNRDEIEMSKMFESSFNEHEDYITIQDLAKE
jgi:hypothetical protein